MAEKSQAFSTGIKDKVEELENMLCFSKHGEMYDDLEKNLLNWKETKVNIAVVGCSGAGKSTFINAILGLEDNEGEAADTGVTETTKDIKQYSNMKSKNVIFWDLPGVGAPSFEKESYVKATHLEKYDYFLILSSERFSENDIWLANYVKATKRKFFFVRTHVEEDLENDIEAHPTFHNRGAVLAKIRKYCQDNLESIGLKDQKVFLVDSFEKDKHDFKSLSEELVTESSGLKSCLIADCIGPVTEAVIEQKTYELKQRINVVANMCEHLNNSPDTKEKARNLYFSECSLYRRMFEVDEVAVRHHASMFQLSPVEISKELRQLQALNESSGFLYGFSLTIGNLGQGHGMSKLVALHLLDYLNKLHDHAIKHAEMLNAEVSKNINKSFDLKCE